jgi:hypothetical protein
VLQWTFTGPITGSGTNNGFGWFTTNAPGFATITCKVLQGEGCFQTGYTETYAFVIQNPSPSGLIHSNNNNSKFKNVETVERMSIFPNPNNQDYVLIQIPSHFSMYNASVAITDLYGKIVKTIAIKDFYQELDIKELENGIYFIQLNDGVKSQTERLIIQK